MCEEWDTRYDRTGRPVLVGQSDPLFVPTSVMKTLTPLTRDLAQEDILQKYQERVESLSQQNLMWLRFVLMQDSWPQFDVGQYFMTKDTE